MGYPARLLKFWSGVGVFVLLGGAILICTQIHDEDGDPLICKDCWIGGHHHHASEGAPWRSIHRVARAQIHYYRTDPDGKGRNEYWKKDIAGLWAHPDRSGDRIGLIQANDAAADDHPVVDLTPWMTPGSYDGYRLRALLHEDEPVPSPSRYAACLYPESAAAGRWTYIVDEAGVIYRKDLGKAQWIPVYPKDPAASGWNRYREVRY